MRRALLFMAVPIAAAVIYACGSSDDFSAAANDGGFSDGSGFADGGAPLVANGILLVHAAAFPAFRVCFKGALAEQPFPSDTLMPDSNVVGVDVGSAVRLSPIQGDLDVPFLYEESAIRALYQAGAEGPSCNALLQDTKIANIALPPIDADVSSGIHLLVLVGCRAKALDPFASIDHCGPSWSEDTGNLELVHVEVQATSRLVSTTLLVQAALFSPALVGAAGDRAIGVGYGLLEAGAPSALRSLDGLTLFQPSALASVLYSPEDVASYAANGFFVTLGSPQASDAGDAGDAGDAADASTEASVAFAQSLADIQALSAPGDIPSSYYATASSYVLLIVGDPDPRMTDGGPDPDPRRAPHFLAVPLAVPDAGGDASPAP